MENPSVSSSNEEVNFIPSGVCDQRHQHTNAMGQCVTCDHLEIITSLGLNVHQVWATRNKKNILVIKEISERGILTCHAYFECTLQPTLALFAIDWPIDVELVAINQKDFCIRCQTTTCSCKCVADVSITTKTA